MVSIFRNELFWDIKVFQNMIGGSLGRNATRLETYLFITAMFAYFPCFLTRTVIRVVLDVGPVESMIS